MTTTLDQVRQLLDRAAAADEASADGDGAAAIRYVPISRRLLADSLTPVTAYAALARHAAGQPAPRGAFLFESVVSSEKIGRYSFLGVDPKYRFEAAGRRIRWTDRSSGAAVVDETTVDDPLAALETRLAAHRALETDALPRFAGGAVGYFAYDSVRYVEHLPDAPPDDRRLPDISLGFYEQMVIFDHLSKAILLVGQIDRTRIDAVGLETAYADAVAGLDTLSDRLFAAPAAPQATPIDTTGPVGLAYESNFTRGDFEAAVDRGKEYIRAGDVFQFVPSQRLQVQTEATPLNIYRALRVINPSPFMFLCDLPDPQAGDGERFQLIGASPEIMTRVEGDAITVRPLAGTRPRGRTEAEDLALERELLADEKERAEHVMLVDLARNDIGRVARYGSVELTDVMSVERYSHVMHISSNVVGRMRPGLTALDAMRATLPAGTVSGAPKVRAMEIIDELEPHRRGPYGGAVGYLDFTGDMDLCIALRTLVMRGRTCWVQAGCGVVADSVPAAEYDETINKAKGLLKAIEVAETQLRREAAS